MEDFAFGIDALEIERFKAFIQRHEKKALTRLFTERELESYHFRFDGLHRLALRFAAKEAVLKALGTGLSAGTCWRDIEILNTQYGSPVVNVFGKVKELIGLRRILLSLSDTKNLAIAAVVLVPGDS